jgi:predicted TIM-barrel fold metal-dependent hydrolase
MKNKILFSLLFTALVLVLSNYLCAQTSPGNILLKNFRPVSIFNTPKSTITKAKYSVIDFHSHAYVTSEKELDKWVQTMDSFGIEKTIILTESYGREFDSLVTFFSKYPTRFILFCGLNYTGYDKPGFGPAAIKELKRCVERGAKGIGELGDKGKGLFYCKPPAWGMHIDDARMDALLEECAKLNLPVVIHVGEPQWFYEPMDSTNDGLMNSYNWRLDNQKGILTLDEELKTLENAVIKHPKTIFVACHFGNQVTDLAKLGNLFDKYSNLYADIAARLGEVAAVPKYARAFMEKYNEKLLFGTDNDPAKSMYEFNFRILETTDEHFYAVDLTEYHWALYGLGLSNGTLKKLYMDNALKILNPKK